MHFLGGKIAHIGDEIHLLDRAGKVLHIASNDNSKSRRASTTTPTISEWVAKAEWEHPSTSLMNQSAVSWTVPPAPTTDHGQTIFLFSAVQPATRDSIVAPTLQWEVSAAGGGSYWSLVSWYVIGTQVYHTAPYKQVPGDWLNSAVVGWTTGSGATLKYGWGAEFANIKPSLSTPGPTWLEVDSTELMVWAAQGVQATGITTASDYPAGSSLFSYINIYDSAGQPTVTWTTAGSGGLTTTVNTQGAVNGAITVTY